MSSHEYFQRYFREETSFEKYIEHQTNMEQEEPHQHTDKPPIPPGAYDIEVFAVKPSQDHPSGKQAFIGYKVDLDGKPQFHYIQVEFTAPEKDESGRTITVSSFHHTEKIHIQE